MVRLEGGTITGRNVQWASFATGPGYFTVKSCEQEDCSVLFDYVNLATTKPGDWPAVKPNSRGVSFFVFRGLTDHMRRVSEHVTIGKALRNGKDLGQFFMLVRED